MERISVVPKGTHYAYQVNSIDDLADFCWEQHFRFEVSFPVDGGAWKLGEGHRAVITLERDWPEISEEVCPGNYLVFHDTEKDWTFEVLAKDDFENRYQRQEIADE